MANLKVQAFALDALHTYHRNPRRGDVDAIAESLKARGQYRPIVVNVGTHASHDYEILAGNHTYMAARKLGWETIQATTVDVDDDQAAQIVLADNRLSDLGGYDESELAALLSSVSDLEGTGYTPEDLKLISESPADTTDEEEPETRTSLRDRYGAPPFTVLDSRSGPWRDRKKAWIGLGLRSDAGRPDDLLLSSPSSHYRNWYEVKNRAEAEEERKLSREEVVGLYGDQLKPVAPATSVFDPVLAELMISWHSRTGDRIIDPWAGGSVRGVVSAALGRDYTGIELRGEQIEENRRQAPTVAANLGNPESWIDPTWVEGDSTERLGDYPDSFFDMAIGCPPYYGLEKYSDDPRDLSTMRPKDFDHAMAKTLSEMARVLRPDSFAVFIVASVRDKRDGHILDMRRCMSEGCEAAGMTLVNDAILLNSAGNAAIRCIRAFTQTRTLTRVHQEILVYCKGNRRKAAKRLGAPDTGTLTDPSNEPNDET
ncbi:ParB/RepB/Spo0J family partition protein [Bifidobacterium platyrrhinorum]|nr:ParB N-terminal domain-containing protein [Bifidobacterium platyrrhinorum]